MTDDKMRQEAREAELFEDTYELLAKFHRCADAHERQRMLFDFGRQQYEAGMRRAAEICAEIAIGETSEAIKTAIESELAAPKC